MADARESVNKRQVVRVCTRCERYSRSSGRCTGPANKGGALFGVNGDFSDTPKRALSQLVSCTIVRGHLQTLPPLMQPLYGVGPRRPIDGDAPAARGQPVRHRALRCYGNTNTTMGTLHPDCVPSFDSLLPIVWRCDGWLPNW